MEINEYNTTLAKLLQGLKKDLGATTIRQGYKGTGSKSFKRQIFVRFANDKHIDLWLESNRVECGGVIRTRFGNVPHNNRTPTEVYKDIVEVLRPLAV